MRQVSFDAGLIASSVNCKTRADSLARNARNNWRRRQLGWSEKLLYLAVWVVKNKA
jgi:hypothetical protein